MKKVLITTAMVLASLAAKANPLHLKVHNNLTGSRSLEVLIIKDTGDGNSSIIAQQTLNLTAESAGQELELEFNEVAFDATKSYRVAVYTISYGTIASTQINFIQGKPICSEIPLNADPFMSR